MPKNLNTLQEQREELNNKFDTGLPDYFVEYFDEQEKDSYEEKLNNTLSDEEFWANTKAELVKVKRRVRKGFTPKYEEPPRAEERIQQEEGFSEEKRKALIKLCEKDLYLFAISYFPHYLKLPSSELHKFLYNLITDEFAKDRKDGFKQAIAAPRGNAKSTIISTIFPLWCIVYNKKKFIIIISNTQGQAIDFLSDIKRELESNLKLQRDFPHIIGKGGTWKTDEVITKNDIKLLALGTGNKVLGRRFGVHRPSLLILDDLENPDMVRSKTTREFIRYEWFNKSLLYVGGEKGTTTDFLLVGTIQGDEALLNSIINKGDYPDWNVNKFQAVEIFSTSELWDTWEDIYTNRLNSNRKEDAEKFFEENKEEMLKGTKVLWPDGDPYYDLMVEKLSDESAFNSEKQNNPIDKSKLLVSIDDIHFEDFKNDFTIANMLLDPKLEVVGSIDPSLGKNTSADYSCITTLKKNKKTGYIYVVDFNIKRRTVDDQIEAILDLYNIYRHDKFACETNAFQIVLADNLRKESKVRGLYVPVTDLNNYKDKHMRLESIAPLIKDGTIIFDRYKYENDRQYNLALEMIVKYTENATHDDSFDSLEMGVRLCRVKPFKRIYSHNRK